MTSGHADFQTIAVMRGLYAGEQITLAVDALGRLRVLRILQPDITTDLVEATTWDSPPTTFLHNMNRIRNQIIAITGEVWGTVSHSIATVWAKFHATTGHTHTGTGTDAPTIDHGTTTGRTDDDHERYFDKNCDKALTSDYLYRDINTGSLMLSGGKNTVGNSALLRVYGCDHADYPGWIMCGVPNAAKDTFLEIMRVVGAIDAPVTDWRARRLTNVADPTSAQDAETLAAHNADTTLFKCDGSRAITGELIKRNVNDNGLIIEGGTGETPYGAYYGNIGGAHSDAPGQHFWYVGNAAGTAFVCVMYIPGNSNTPYLHMLGHKISNVLDPVAAQDAMTKNAHDTDTTLFKCNGSRAFTGGELYRSVDNAWLSFVGGSAYQHGAQLYIFGRDYSGAYKGGVSLRIMDANKTTASPFMHILGVTDNPFLDMLGHLISGLHDPVSAQDAATKKWVEDHFVAK